MLRSIARTAISTLALTALTATTARAELTWPDVPERVERGLASPDVATRRNAARELASLGPGRAEPLVARAFGDADVEVRVAAARAAAKLHLASAVDAALPWLGEREIRLKIAACELAEKLPSRRSVPALSRALGDAEPLVRAACVDALGASHDPAATSALTSRLDDAAPAVRAQVARALARLGDERAVVPLVGKVQDSVPDVRQAVVRALGELHDPRASSALLLALRDGAPEVKIEALTAVGRSKLAEGASVVEPFAFDKNPMIRSAALVALGRIATPDAVRALVRALAVSPEELGNPTTRTPVRAALVSAGAAAIPELSHVLERSGPAQVTSAAAWVLGELGAHEAAAAIVAALRAGSLSPAAALHALAGAGTAREVPVALEFVADPSPAVRAEARAATHALLDPRRPDGRAVEPLSAALRDPRLAPAERAEVCALLGRTGAPRAASELVPLVRVKDRALRIAAIDALGVLRSDETKGAYDALVPALSDADAEVRVHAATSLARGGDDRARRAVEAALVKGEVERMAALTALGGILERHPDDGAALARFADLPLAFGPERDALIEAAGRSRGARVVEALARVVDRGNVPDRRMVAQVLALYGGFAGARALLQRLASDPDDEVRAQATYALGTAFPDGTTLTYLARATDGEVDAIATDAAAAVARAAAAYGPANVTSFACPRLRHARPLVVANALAALAARSLRCGTGEVERTLLEAPDERVRLAAARLVAATAKEPDDRTALARCASGDGSAEVADACAGQVSHHVDDAEGASMTVYVHATATTPPAAARPYVVELPGGALRAGLTDRRGAFFEARSPPGDVVVRRVP